MLKRLLPWLKKNPPAATAAPSSADETAPPTVRVDTSMRETEQTRSSPERISGTLSLSLPSSTEKLLRSFEDKAQQLSVMNIRLRREVDEQRQAREEAERRLAQSEAVRGKLAARQARLEKKITSLRKSGKSSDVRATTSTKKFLEQEKELAASARRERDLVAELEALRAAMAEKAASVSEQTSIATTIPLPSVAEVECDIRLAAECCVALGLAEHDWFEGASITIGHTAARRSKGGATRAGRVKISIALPPGSFTTRDQINAHLTRAVAGRRTKYASDYRRYLRLMNEAGMDYFRLEYHAIRLDPQIGDGPFDASTARQAMRALIAHEVAHAVVHHQKDRALERLGLTHLPPNQCRAHQKLWQEVYRLLRVTLLNSPEDSSPERAAVLQGIREAISILRPVLSPLAPNWDWSTEDPAAFLALATRAMDINHDWEIFAYTDAWDAAEILDGHWPKDPNLHGIILKLSDIAWSLALGPDGDEEEDEIVVFDQQANWEN